MITSKVSTYGGKILALGAILLLFQGINGYAAEKKDFPDLYEKAKQEGKVVFYASMQAKIAQSLADTFEKRFPGIKVEVFRALIPELLQKVTVEALSGRHFFDVTDMSTEVADTLKKRDLVAAYRPSSYAMFPKGFADPEGYWVSEYINPLVISYNTKLLKPGEVPQIWEGLLDSKWKGRKLGYDPYIVTPWWMGMRDFMGEEKALKYAKQLATQDVWMGKGQTNMLQSMSIGEFQMMIYSLVSSLEVIKGTGAPIEWVRMKSPIPTSIETASVSKHAPHPNAARLFYEFIASKEGQQVLAANEKAVVRSDVEGKHSHEFKKLDLRPIRIVTAEEYAAATNQIFGILGH